METPNARNDKKSSADGKAHNLRDLLVAELKDIYWAEKALTQAIPKMVAKATSDDLKSALLKHLEETKGHVNRLEDVFKKLNEPIKAKKCEAIAGIIKEAEQIMDETQPGDVRDAGIVSAGQKVEHYEIATYGTLASFARILGESEAWPLLEDTLQEEKAAAEKLTKTGKGLNNLVAR